LKANVLVMSNFNVWRILETSKYKLAPKMVDDPSGCLPPSLAAQNLLTKVLALIYIYIKG
jgi:hypothetical protein